MVCRAWSDTEERGERDTVSVRLSVYHASSSDAEAERLKVSRSSRRQNGSQWWQRLGVLTGRDLEALGSSHQFPGRRTSQG